MNLRFPCTASVNKKQLSSLTQRQMRY